MERPNARFGSFLTLVLFKCNARLTPHSSALRASTFPLIGVNRNGRRLGGRFQKQQFFAKPSGLRALKLPPWGEAGPVAKQAEKSNTEDCESKSLGVAFSV